MKDFNFYNKTKNEFIHITNSVEDNEININGPIGGDSIFDYGYSFDDFKRDISKINGQIKINIKSYGGNLFEALAIYDFIRSLKNNVTTRIVGTSASAATIISLAGDQRLISKNSRYLIHKPSIMAMGNSDDFKKILDQLEDLDKQLVDLYAERTNMSKEDVLELMTNEEFISSQDAINKGFIDGYIEEKSKNKPKNNKEISEMRDVIDNFLNEKNINIMELVENLKQTEKTTKDVETETQEVTSDTPDETDTLNEEVKEDIVDKKEDKDKDKEEENKEEDKDKDKEEENKEEEKEEEDDKDKIIKELKEEIKKLKKDLAKNVVDEAEEKAMELTTFLDEAIETGKIKEESRDEWMNIGVEQGIAVLKTLMSSIPEKKVSTEKLRDVVTKSDSFQGKEDIIKQWKKGEIDTETYLNLVKTMKK